VILHYQETFSFSWIYEEIAVTIVNSKSIISFGVAIYY